MSKATADQPEDVEVSTCFFFVFYCCFFFWMDDHLITYSMWYVICNMWYVICDVCCLQVRLVDQEKINEFGRLNNRLLEIRADITQFKSDIEKLEDATAELMINSGDGKVMLFMGESFIETTEDYANECKFLFELLAKIINFFFFTHFRAFHNNILTRHWWQSANENKM